jgi:hypothetical protein
MSNTEPQKWFKIEYRDSSVVAPGGVIAGHVDISFAKPKCIRAIHFTVHGEGKTFWTRTYITFYVK